MSAVEETVKRFGLDVRKFACGNRVVYDWNSFIITTCKLLYSKYFKNIFQLNWNRKLINCISCVLFEIAGVIRRLSLCLLMPAVSSTWLASVKSVK